MAYLTESSEIGKVKTLRSSLPIPANYARCFYFVPGMMNGPTMGDSMYGGVDPNMYGGSMSASGYPSYNDDYTDPMRSGGSAGQTSPWTSAMQQRFSASGPYTQNQQQMPPTTGMSGHYGSMYNRMNMAQQRMSPQRPQDKPFFGTPHKQVLCSINVLILEI